MLLRSLIALALIVPAARLGAQNATSQPSDSVFVRAQRMVTEGQGDAGRALVQRELDAAPLGSPRYVDALFWRASLASTAAEAERDYRKIIIEYSLSPRASDALLRMGQLEMARGEREQAIEHFRRLVLEHPTHPQRARASYWSAQLHFQANNLPRACATLAEARRSSGERDVELRNQIEYYEPRCAGVDTTIVVRVIPTPAPTPGPASAESTSRPSPIPAARPAAAWTVQVGAFRTRQSADQLRTRLAARGYSVRTVRVGALWHVRVGRYETRQAADGARERMRARDVRGLVVEMERP
jgi:cell division septation protein DedD